AKSRGNGARTVPRLPNRPNMRRLGEAKIGRWSVSDFKGTMPQNPVDQTRAIARLPALNIEIAHGRGPAGGSEWINIRLAAAPSFAAFGRWLEFANPLAYWTEAVRLAWLPWLGTAPRIGLLDQAREPGTDLDRGRAD